MDASFDAHDLGRLRPHKVHKNIGVIPSDRFSPSKKERTEIAPKAITDVDIYCGRKHRGSPHPGNVAYRRMIEENEAIYKEFARIHKMKTAKSTFLLEKVIKGRFVKMDPIKKRYVLLTKEEARDKIRQALCDK